MALVLRAESPSPGDQSILLAAAALRRGGAAVFPTETVYGIGADVHNAAALTRIYEMKKRNPARPLLAHCSDESQLDFLVAEVPEGARQLMRRFWPGPLSLVFRSAAAVPAVATGGGSTIGVRMVAHPAARALIRALGSPIAGTSANVSGEPATSRFESISPALLDSVDVALDAGVCGAELASTVLDVTVWPPRVLRLGAVSVQAIEEVAGRL
jgi:L-threonylcarbamoyladenylate synthase